MDYFTEQYEQRQAAQDEDQAFWDNLRATVPVAPKRLKRAPHICRVCAEVATYYSLAGLREITISGVCEPCFDAMFAEGE